VIVTAVPSGPVVLEEWLLVPDESVQASTWKPVTGTVFAAGVQVTVTWRLPGVAAHSMGGAGRST
jgi:hypothetical protein